MLRAFFSSDLKCGSPRSPARKGSINRASAQFVLFPLCNISTLWVVLIFLAMDGNYHFEKHCAIYSSPAVDSRERLIAETMKYVLIRRQKLCFRRRLDVSDKLTIFPSFLCVQLKTWFGYTRGHSDL